MKAPGLLLALFIVSLSYGQDISVEYDKDHDFAKYKTFRFGEVAVITPKDQRQVSEEQMHKWVQASISREFTSKGLTQVDSGADITISYAVGAMTRSNAGSVGPMGLTPGSMERNYMREFDQGSLIIDLNDRSNLLIWRVNATTNSTVTDAETLIDAIVAKGFKKFGKPEKKKKKK